MKAARRHQAAYCPDGAGRRAAHTQPVSFPRWRDYAAADARYGGGRWQVLSWAAGVWPTISRGANFAARAGQRSTQRVRPVPDKFSGVSLLMVVLLTGGAAVFGAGAAADVVYHAFPGTGLAALLEPLAGSGGGRAHVITLAGMAAIVAGLVVRGAAHAR